MIKHTISYSYVDSEVPASTTWKSYKPSYLATPWPGQTKIIRTKHQFVNNYSTSLSVVHVLQLVKSYSQQTVDNHILSFFIISTVLMRGCQEPGCQARPPPESWVLRGTNLQALSLTTELWSCETKGTWRIELIGKNTRN